MSVCTYEISRLLFDNFVVELWLRFQLHRLVWQLLAKVTLLAVTISAELAILTPPAVSDARVVLSDPDVRQVDGASGFSEEVVVCTLVFTEVVRTATDGLPAPLALLVELAIVDSTDHVRGGGTSKFVVNFVNFRPK